VQKSSKINQICKFKAVDPALIPLLTSYDESDLIKNQNYVSIKERDERELEKSNVFLLKMFLTNKGIRVYIPLP